MRARRGWMVAPVAVVMVVIVVVIASSSARRSGAPFDPASTDPDGAKALVELLGAFDTEVVVRLGAAEQLGAGDVVLALEGGLTDDDVDRLRQAARDGAAVVVAQPDARLTPEVTGSVDIDAVLLARRCTGFDGVEELQGLTTSYAVGAGDLSCFATEAGAALVVRDVGRGRIVSVGGPDVFTNHYLDEHDNAVLATSLLVGRGPVQLVRPAPLTSGDKTLLELLPAGFWRLVAQGLVAMALLAWASARRHGRPVREPMLWPLPGTAATESVAELYHRTNRYGLSARWLRARLRRSLLRRYQLPPGSPTAELSRLLELERPGSGVAELAWRTLEGPDPDTNEELLALAAATDQLRREVSDERT